MSDIAELTTLLAPAIEAVIEQEVVRRVGALELKRKSQRRTRDEMIDDACHAVAAATDRLQQARFSGNKEVLARNQLERACNALCKVMRGRPR